MAHGIADAITGFTVVTLALTQPAHIIPIIIGYNVLAFALQPLAGLIVDTTRAYHVATFSSLASIGVGLVTFSFLPIIGLFLIALGSSFFHASGGALAAQSTPQSAVGPSLFTSPGVIGLALGSVAGMSTLPISLLLLFLLAACGLTLFIIPRRDSVTTPLRTPVAVSSLILFLALLGLGVSFRSAIWSSVGILHISTHEILLLGAGAALGKLLGGFAGDRMGWMQTVVIGTLLAGVFLSFPNSFILIILGVLFLQSSTPLVLAAFVRFAPRFPATVAGSVQGLSIAFGALFAKIFLANFSLGTLSSMTLFLILAGLFGVGFSIFSQKNAAQTNLSQAS